MDARQRNGEAAVAFVGGEGNHAGVGDEKICAGNAHVGGEKVLPKLLARDHCQFFRRSIERRAEALVEIFGDVGLTKVHDRRDNVVGGFVAELADVFAEVGLDRLDAGGFKRGVEVDFLGRHGFGFDDFADAVLSGEC